MRVKLLWLSSLSLILTACPPDPVEDPGNCWVPLGDMKSVSVLGWTRGALSAGTTAGEVACWNGTTWTPSSVASAPIRWMTSTPAASTAMPDVIVATDTELYRGTCATGWTPHGSWSGNLGSVYSGSGILDLVNHEQRVAFVTANHELLLSMDAGMTWAVIADTFTMALPGGANHVTILADGTVMASNAGATATFDGSTWTASFAINPGDGVMGWTPLDHVVMLRPGGAPTVNRTTDAGASWTQPCCATFNSSTPISVTSDEPDPQGSLHVMFVGTASSGVALSNDDGASWERYPGQFPVSGLGNPVPAVVSVDIDPSGLPTLGTSKGVYRDNSSNPTSPCRKPRRLASGPVDDPRLLEAVWSDGATAPLGCDLDVDCCAELGVCDALAAGSDGGLAEHEVVVAGTVEVAHWFGVDTFEVAGTARWSAPSCDNADGSCPMFLEALDLDAAGVKAGGETWVSLEGLTASLHQPALGAWRPQTGELLIPGERLVLDLDAAASATWLGGEGPLELTQHPDGFVGGAVTDRGLSLVATHERLGVVVTLRLE
ncbi:MAG: hypothetical protein ABMA64_32750 [Myxococcota bacterium]